MYVYVLFLQMYFIFYSYYIEGISRQNFRAVVKICHALIDVTAIQNTNLMKASEITIVVDSSFDEQTIKYAYYSVFILVGTKSCSCSIAVCSYQCYESNRM